jgi:hypothetical protein
MPFCPHCGGEVDHLVETASPVEEAVSAEVEIARINAERDVKVAQIAARQDKDWNETHAEVAEIEADAEVAAAEATAEVIGEVIAAEGDAPAEEETDPVVVVEAPPEDPEPETAPPPAEETTPKETSKGWWDAYR